MLNVILFLLYNGTVRLLLLRELLQYRYRKFEPSVRSIFRCLKKRFELFGDMVGAYFFYVASTNLVKCLAERTGCFKDHVYEFLSLDRDVVLREFAFFHNAP